jgi:hypothetical protein
MMKRSQIAVKKNQSSTANDTSLLPRTSHSDEVTRKVPLKKGPPRSFVLVMLMVGCVLSCYAI